MADNTLSWGVLGTGEIARKFAGDLATSRTGRLVAVGSRSQESADRFGEQFGAGRRHDSYEALLADDGVQAVYIALPHPMHAKWAVRAAEAGKHILCEKPLSLNRAWTEAIIEAARRHDVFLMEAFMYRAHPQAEAIHRLVREGAIGRVLHIQSSLAFASKFDPDRRLFDPALGGGGILDVGGYPVSLARLVAGAAVGRPFAEPDEVTAVGHLGETGVDEWAAATLRFEGGITAQVTTGVRLTDGSELRVVGSEGYLVVDNPWFPTQAGVGRIAVHRVGAEPEDVIVPDVGDVRLYAFEADAVAEHLAERQAPAMSWADSLGNAAVLDQWRAALGQSYPVERDDADVPVVHGRALAPRPGHDMRYARVPGIDKDVSRLVMGSIAAHTIPQASVLYDEFVERGGNCFDVAYIYNGGRSEQLLGQWMVNRGNREDVVVIGKGAHTPHCDPESITSQLHVSLDRLQTDYIDQYFMHRDNTDVPVGEFVDVLDEHYRAGRIRAFGGSNWTLRRFDEANEYARANGRHGFTALSNQFSLGRPLEPMWSGCRDVTDPASVQWLIDTGVVLFPFSSQARGFFAGRADPDDRSDADLVRCWYSDENFARLDRVRKVAGDLGVPTAAIALAFVLHQQFAAFPLIGPETLAELRTSLLALTVELTPQQIRWLNLADESSA
jgi:predicted dehydrogenase/aryl-alcohol dehydrogenase-like predicted oxidoreductase